MLSLTLIVFIVGVIAVVASWVVAVRLIASDPAAGALTSPAAHRQSTRSNELAEAHSS